MKKLKDFFYNKNDIIIVLLIVAAAAFIIYTRIDAIMGYPEQYAREVAATETRETATIAETSDESSSGETTVTIEDSDTSSSVADKLYEAGLVDSADEFETFISESGASDSIQTGTFQIPADSTNEEILDIIT